MESVRDHNVDPPDRRKVWEAPSHTRSTAGPLTTPPPQAFPRLFRWLANQLNPLVGLYLTTVLVEARWFK